MAVAIRESPPAISAGDFAMRMMEIAGGTVEVGRWIVAVSIGGVPFQEAAGDMAEYAGGPAKWAIQVAGGNIEIARGSARQDYPQNGKYYRGPRKWSPVSSQAFWLFG